MLEFNSSKLIRLAAIKPFEDEHDVCVTNIDGTIKKVHDAPVIRSLSRGLGIPLEIVISDTEYYGSKQSDGNWSGIIGMLIRGEADMSVSGLTSNEERREVVNFTFPLYVSDVSFITNKPEPHPKTFAIFETFSFEVWIGITVSIIFTSLLLCYLLKKKQTFSSILMAVIGNLLEKPFPFQERRGKSALLLIFWLIGATILANSYKSVILSVITFPKLEGIRDISDLAKAAKEGSVTCISYKGGIPSVRWFELNDDRLNAIGECMKRSEFEGLHGIEDFENYPYKKAFIADRLDLMVQARSYFISDESFSLSHIGIAHSKTFCCPRKLESVIHRITEAGLYAKTLRDRRFIIQLRMCPSETASYERTHILPLTLKDFTGAFLVLFVGYLISFSVLLFEVFDKKRK